jgi:Flp pilus assembly protein TadB
MSDSASTRSISDEAAMLIERAVRGEISPEQRTRLDALIEADPVVAEEFQRAQREEHAMSTVADLFTQRSDSERMQLAIRQKLDWDRNIIRRFVVGFVIWVPIYLLFFVSQPWNWQLLVAIAVVPMLPVVVWGMLTARRQLAFREAVEAGDASVADEFSRHLTRSRNENTINRAGFVVACFAMVVMMIHDYSTGNYARAVLSSICFVVVFTAGTKVVFSRRYQELNDLFYQGRLTLEELFEKRAESTESDGE